MPRIYTGGTFDLFHAGHVNFLRQCKRLAGPDGLVIVALNTDEFIKRFKGKAPLYTYEERWELLKGCKYVDLVIPNIGEEDSKLTIQQSNADYVVIGSDWACKDYYSQMGFTQAWLDDQDIQLVYVPYTAGISTTELKRRLLDYES